MLVRSPGRLLLLASVLVAGCGPARHPGAVLITVDTLRADYVGAFGGVGTDTPRIDALAREGTVFERAVSPLPLTRPAHFSMLTAKYPREHGVLNNAMALPETAHTLPEILREHGWRTAAFTAVSILKSDSGAAQGFERFESTRRGRERRGAEVVGQALGWLESLRPGEPFFLWIHLYEPHQPYAPPPEFHDGLDPALLVSFPSLGWQDFERIARTHGGDIPKPIAEHARQLYRAEVRHADRLVGSFLDGLAARVDPDGLLVLLTADHGECFEKGIWFEHSDCLYEGSLRVPLIARQPGVFPAGASVNQPVGVVDVMPTVLRSAGLPVPAGIAGRPLQESASFDERWLLVQYPFYDPRNATTRGRRASVIKSVAGEPTRGIVTDSRWTGVVGARWKFLARDDGIEELYPLAPRVDESENRAAGEPEVAAELRRRLAEKLAAHPLTQIDGGEVSPELRKALEALGYVQ